MKTTMQPAQAPAKPTFPHLGIIQPQYSSSAPFVVLFTSKSRGTVVCTKGPCSWTVGYTQSSWDYAQFVPYEGTITLSND